MSSRGSKQFYLRYRNRRKPFQNKLYNGFYSAIKSVFDDVIKNLENGKKYIPSKKNIQGRIWESTRAGYKMVITAGFKFGLSDAEERYGKTLPPLLEKALSEEDLLMLGLNAVIQRIQINSMLKVVTIAASLHAKLQKIFEESARQMEGIPQLLARVKQVAEEVDPTYPKWMAQRISQTETTRAFAAATLEGYKKSTVVSGKEWVSNLMGNPRTPPKSEFDHLGAHGEVVALDDPFVLTGEDLMYPGDDDGSAGNVINCFPEDVFTFCKNIEAVSKRWYDGNLITIWTSAGNVLSTTPNHPVFTLDGWIPMKSLIKGSNIISSTCSKREFFGNPNINENPIRINQMYDSFLMPFAARQRTVGRDVYFHGDGGTSDVNIAFSKGFLENTRNTPFSQPISKNNFTVSDSCFGSLQSNGFSRKFRNSFFLSSNSIVSGGSNSLPIFRRGFGVSDSISLLDGSNNDIGFDECPSYDTSVNIERFCNGVLGFSIGVTIDNIIRVEVNSFHGFVYNLQSENGWLIASNIIENNDNVKGIICHNCHCAMMPVIDLSAYED